MKRKLLSVITALALCLSLLPGTAWAVDETPPMLIIGSASLVAGKSYVAAETGAVTEKTPETPENTPYLECSDGGTLTVHGEFVTNAPLTVIFDLTVTGEAGSSLTVTTANDQAIKLAGGALTLDGDVDFTGNCSDSNVIAILGDAGTFETAETYSGDIVLCSDNIYIPAVFNASLDVQNSASIAITGTINSQGSVVLKSTGDITCESSTVAPAIAGPTEISAEGKVTISSNNGAPVHLAGVNGGLTVTKAQSVTISGASSSGSPFFPVPVKFEDCGSVTVTDSGDGDFLGAGCTLSSAVPVSVRKDGGNKLYLDGTLWTNAGAAPEALLDLEDITTPTYWKAGEGRIFYEPAAADGSSAAKLTLDSAEYDGEISANEAKGLDVTVKGSNQIGVIANQNGNLTLTGDGSLTANQVVTQQGNNITNNIAGTLNTVLVQYGGTGNKNTYEVYGEAELSNGLTLTEGDTGSFDDAVLTIQPEATLTIPSGKTLEIRKSACLINNGTIVNNGTVSLAGEAATGANAETVRGLDLTGDGMVQVMTNPGGGEEVAATYTNSGEERLTPVDNLNLSQTKTEQTSAWESRGYKWTNVETDDSNNITKGTLTLAPGFSATKVTLPGNGANVTVKAEGDSSIGTLKYEGASTSTSIKLTFEGGKLAVAEHINFSGDVGTSVTIANGAVVEANKGITVSAAAGVDGTITVKGTLTARGESGGAAVLTGKISVGPSGKLEVYGDTGVSLGGMSTGDINKKDFAGAFTIQPGGRFEAHCAPTIISASTQNESLQFSETKEEEIIVVPNGYLPSGCVLAFSNGKKELTIPGDGSLFNISVDNVPPSGGGGWVGPSTYTVTVEKPEHGEVSANCASASSGTTVTLTVTPDGGYVLSALTVTDSQGNEITLTAQGDGKYTFTMPSRAVTVRAAFACTGGADCPSRAFPDLDTGKWYHEAVDYVLENDLMDGYDNGLFGPDDTLTRAQFVQILFNKEGRPVVNYLLRYDDVAPGAWYTEAVRWAASLGIAGGYGNGMFGPNDDITREQLTVMLWRYAGSPAATEKELHFTDADKASGYALEALRWAAEIGVFNDRDGTLEPTGQVTRAETAQMLKIFMEGQ